MGVAAATLALAGLVAVPVAAGAAPTGPTLSLPDLGYYGSTNQQVLVGYDQLTTDVVTAPDPSTGQAVVSVELVIPGFDDQIVAAPGGGSGSVTFGLPTGSPGYHDGYVIAVDASGETSAQAPVLVAPQHHSAHITYDTGATHDGYLQVSGDDAHVSVIPDWYDGPAQTDSWLTAISLWFNNRPIGTRTGLHAHGAVTFDNLHDSDGSAFAPGLQQLTVCSTDNHSDQQCYSPGMFVVNPVTASWSVGTTAPDTPTTVTAVVHDAATSAVQSVTLSTRDGTVTATLSNPGATPTISSTMTFDPGLNYPTLVVTLVNGDVYRVYDEVQSLIGVQSTLDTPQDLSWNQQATFSARATSPRGSAQSGLVLHLESSAPGSTTWVQRASATTDKQGRAAIVVRPGVIGSASWRVVSSQTKTQKASTSTAHSVRVRAAFGRLPAARTVRARHAARYSLSLLPATSGLVLAVECRRAGTSTWTTLSHVRSVSGRAAVAVKLARTGRYEIRVVVEQTSSLATTTSAGWRLHVVA